MAQVFSAVDTRLGRKVAIKLAHENFSDRFGREAKAISSLNHPHIGQANHLDPTRPITTLKTGWINAKLAASSVLPVPLYAATSGCGHNGRVRSTLHSPRLGDAYGTHSYRFANLPTTFR